MLVYEGVTKWNRLERLTHWISHIGTVKQILFQKADVECSPPLYAFWGSRKNIPLGPPVYRCDFSKSSVQDRISTFQLRLRWGRGNYEWSQNSFLDEERTLNCPQGEDGIHDLGWVSTPLVTDDNRLLSAGCKSDHTIDLFSTVIFGSDA